MDSETLIRCWDVELIRPACRPGAEIWDAKARLDVDICELLPYLNAVLPGAKFYPASAVLLWKNEGRRYAFRPREIGCAPVKNAEEAASVIADAVQKVNDTWCRRQNLDPDFTAAKDPPGLLEVYKVLPKTNCGECGRATCLLFAKDLREGGATPADCPLLGEPGRQSELQRLIALLG